MNPWYWIIPALIVLIVFGMRLVHRRKDMSDDLWHAEMNLGRQAQVKRDLENAVLHFKEAVSIAEKSGFEDGRLEQSLNLLGLAYMESQDFDQARQVYEQQLALEQRMGGSEGIPSTIALSNLSTVCRLQGNHTDAESYAGRAVQIIERSPGYGSEKLIPHLQNLGAAYLAQEKYAEAAGTFERTLPLIEQKLGKWNPETVMVMNLLAESYLAQGSLQEAESVYAGELAALTIVDGEEDGSLLPVLEKYASVLRRLGKTTEADDADSRIERIRHK